jgi:hypothetical protein
MHQSGHEHTLCYSTCSSTNNWYVPRCLIFRVNFGWGGGGGGIRLSCDMCPWGTLRVVQWQFLASVIFKTQTPCFESWSRVTLPQRTCACTWICAKSVLPGAVLRFQWSANRRVRFSNFIGLPTQRIWVSVCSGTSHQRSCQERPALTSGDMDSHFPHDKCDCTPTHRLVWSCPSLLLSIYSIFHLECQSPGSNSCCPTTRACKSTASWEIFPNLSEVHDSLTLFCR